MSIKAVVAFLRPDRTPPQDLADDHDGPWKAEEYRDVLETWVKWWNGPGREQYRGHILPPLTATAEALDCIGCAGIYEDGVRCKACGRDMSYQR